jgi:hypothetical protein
MDILVIDVGGTSVKLWHTSHEGHKRFDSGDKLTPEQLVEETKTTLPDWKWDAVALGLPCRVSDGRVVEDPQNLGPGWLGFNFAAAMGCPVRLINDAALQALGSFDGGRMLFMGLGTSLGSAFVAERLILSLDLGQLKYGEHSLCELLGDEGFEKIGAEQWHAVLENALPAMKSALMADYLVLGGGGVERVKQLPAGVRRGHNRAVIEGGRRLWERLPEPGSEPKDAWILL